MSRAKLPFIIQSGVRTRGESSVTGLTGIFCAMARYSFAEHGGSIGTKALGVTIPAGAIVFQRLMHVRDSLASSGAAVVGYTLDTSTTLRLSAHQHFSENHGWNVAGVEPMGSIPSSNFVVDQDREVKFVIQDAAVTAGVLDYYVFFLVPQV